MNKLAFTAAAALAAAGAASAQSSVTIYGVADVALSHYRGAGTGTRTFLSSGSNQQSRIGFRGKEDLGGGLFAGFEIEAGMNTDSGLGQATNTNNQASGGNASGTCTVTGATPAAAGGTVACASTVAPNGTQGLTFNRKSFVSLGGSWGEVRLGRDYVPTFWILFAYDPFRTGVGFGTSTTQGASPTTALRASNSIQYMTRPCFAYECQGFHAQAMVASGENASNAATRSDGRLAGLRLGYGGGNWDVAVGHTETKNVAAGDYQQTVAGGSWNFGAGRLLLQAGRHSTGRPVAALANGTKADFWQVGAFINAGTGTVPVAFTHVKRNDAGGGALNKFAIGYVHPLSRRTAIYGTFAHIDNKGSMQLPVNNGGDAGPVPVRGGSASGIDIGLRHSF